MNPQMAEGDIKAVGKIPVVANELGRDLDVRKLGAFGLSTF
jgi:hypothetical protein